MMFRPTLLLWGAVMIAAVPVWADKISVADIAKESPDIEGPVKAAHHPDLSLNVLLASGFPTGFTQAVVLIGDFETNGEYSKEQPQVKTPEKATRRSDLQVNASVNADSLPESTPEVSSFGVAANGSSNSGGWWFSEPRTKFSRSLPETNIPAASMSQGHFDKVPSSISRVWDSWRAEGLGRGSAENYGNPNLTKNTLVPAVAMVPEPGSLSLLLFGLAAVGFFGRRRGQPLIAV